MLCWSEALLSGAPSANKTVNRSSRCASASDRGFQHVLPAHDPDDSVIHFDPVDNGPQVSLSERDIARREALAHDFPEDLDFARWNGRGRPIRALARSDCGIGRLALGLEGRDPILEDVVHVGEAVLDEPVEAAKPGVSLLGLGL